VEFLAALGPGKLLLIWTVILIAALLRAFTGFGFALAAMPIFARSMPPTQAVVRSASLALGIGLVTAPVYAHQVPLRCAVPMSIGAVLGTFAGASLLLQLTPEHFRLGIGLAVICACLALSLYRPRPAPGNAATAGAVGVLSGLLNGIFAIPGPPVIVYALATQAEPARARALLLGFFTVSALVALTAYSAAGLVGWHSLWLFLTAFPVMLIGDRAGLVLFKRYGGALYRRVAIAALLVIGIVTSAEALLQ